MEKNLFTTGGVQRAQSFIRVRCPDCLKLFSINPIEVKTDKPKFACTACSTKFWLSFPECLEQGEIIGFPLEWLEDPYSASSEETEIDKKIGNVYSAPQNDLQIDFEVKEGKRCPKCKTEKSSTSDSECHKCGVIFKKFALKDADFYLPGTKELEEAWAGVLEVYDSLEAHQAFVKTCRLKDKLDFAANKYKNVLQVNPLDKMAEQMQNEIVALSSVSFVPKKETLGTLKRMPFLYLVLLIGAVSMFTGFLVPELRNLVGVGVMFIFLAVATKTMFSKS